MADHAILSASGAHIWLNCAHAARAQLNFPDTETVFSREGTFAHTYAQVMLEKRLTGDSVVKLRDLVSSPEGREFFNPDFLSHVTGYVDRCMEAIEEARAEDPEALVLVEQKLFYDRWVPEGFGTGDLVVVAKGRLRVRDLKFGKGVEIEAEENEQLDLYALGAIDTFSSLYDFDEVVVEIDQPRRNHIDKSEPRPVEQLIKWGDEIVRPRAAVAWEGTGRATAGEHCRFCRARHTCRARMEANVVVEGPDPNQLTDEEVVHLLPKLDQAVKWAHDLKSWALQKAVDGEKAWDGWKLVEGRSNRRIDDPSSLKSVLLDNGFDEAVITEAPVDERPLLGLTELERVVGKKLFTELSAGLVTKPEGQPTLVPEGDKRPVWSGGNKSADEDFE